MVTNTDAAYQAAVPPALAYLARYDQFILYRLDPKPSGKLNKVPLSLKTLRPASAHDPANWMTERAAFARSRLMGGRCGVGFVLTANDDLFCLDVDGCLDGDNWKPIVTDIAKALPGAAMEVSVSGNGLHVWGTYQGTAPEHKKKNTSLGLELYTQERFIALGRPNVKGNAATDCTAYLPPVIAHWFAPSARTAAEWTTGPTDAWNGHTDDATLVKAARRARSANALFGQSVKFADLWDAKASKLADAWPSETDSYDASSADAALAQHLAFWTGKDCERMQRLMELSELKREKWERPDYLHRTILHAVSVCTSVYSRQASVGPPSEAGNGSGAIPSAAYPLGKLGETDVADILISELWELNCYSDARGWFHRKHGELWQLDVGNFVIRNSTRRKMKQTENLKRGSSIRGIIVQLESELSNLEAWDSNPELSGLPDHQVLNLASGQVRPAKATDWISRRLGVLPVEGTPNRWVRFLEETMPINESAAYIPWLQSFFGYVLTGYTRERRLLFLSGSGGNGKTVLIKTLTEIMGDYAVTLPPDALLLSGRSAHPEWKTLLDGPRLASASEILPGMKFNVQLLKEFTGDGLISARGMYKSTYKFHPTAKICIEGNDRPDLDVDPAIKDRMIIFPLERRPAQPDKKLIEKLRAEHGQILAWLIKGAQNYLRNGLPEIPASAQAATADYLASEDQFAQFIEDCFEETPGGWVTNSEIFNASLTWRLGKGTLENWNKTRITKELKKRHYQDDRNSTERGFWGLTLKSLGPGGARPQ